MMSDSDSTEFPTVTRAAWVCLGVIVVVGLVLRLLSAGGDLWLDEIWSLRNIRLVNTLPPEESRWILLMNFNTHPLNSAVMILLGPDASAMAYRIPSVILGSATIAIAALIGWRRSIAEGLAAALLVSISYPLVHYAGEARGYASLVFFTLASLWSLDVYLRRPGARRMLLFVVVSLLGLVAHLTFVPVLAGFGLWAAIGIYQRRQRVSSTVVPLIGLFGAQFLVLEIFTALAIKNAMTAGADPVTAAQAFKSMLLLTFGVDAMSGGPVIIAVMIIGLLALSLYWLYRREGSITALFLVVVLAYPIALIVVDVFVESNRRFTFQPRFIIASAALALMLAAHGLAHLWGRDQKPRIMAGVLLSLFCISNGLLLGKFLTAGRGDYGLATRYIAEQTTGTAIVAGYKNFRVKTLLTYHSKRLGLTDRFRFVTQMEEPPGGAQWWIDRILPGDTPESTITRNMSNAAAVPYRLDAYYPNWGLSGSAWAVYRRYP